MAIPEHIIISEDTSKLEEIVSSRRCFALIDNNLRHHPLARMFGEKVLYIDASEDIKTLSTIEMFAVNLLDRGVDRDTTLVGVGGGITTDITGFLAAIYMRGIRCGLVPTTLLSQVDATVGSKNGVNVNHYKNILGTIRNPDFIYLCPEVTLSTDVSSNLNGIAEMLKIFILRDEEYYQMAVDHYTGRCRHDLTDLIRRAVEIHYEIVEEDPQEWGVRRLLNLGHTFGHAIEKCGEMSMPHGKAVAVGTIIAGKIACKMGIMKEADYQRIYNDFCMIGLPTQSPVTLSSLMGAIRKDKKKVGNVIFFVMPTRVGEAVIKPLTFEEIEHYLSSI